MSTLRVYSPVVVLVLWAFAATVTNEAAVTVVALLALAWSLTLHISECRHYWRGHP